MRLVNVSLEELVLAKGGRAHGALVAEVRRLERLLVVFGDVVKQLPLVDLAADGAAARVLSLVDEVLHGGRDEAVRAEQVAFEALVGSGTGTFGS